MAKRATTSSGTPKRAKQPGRTAWEATYVCTSRGCGKEHRLCVEAPKLPAAADWFVYVCPTTHLPTGARFTT